MFCGYVIRGDMFYTIFAACLFANRKLLISLIKSYSNFKCKTAFLTSENQWLCECYSAAIFICSLKCKMYTNVKDD